MQVNTYIGFLNLEDEMHSIYEICGEVAFKTARAMIFSKSDGTNRSFRSGQENPDLFVRQPPLPVYTYPKGS